MKSSPKFIGLNVRDAMRLAQLLRAGKLTSIWVPSEEDEALRDMVRASALAKEDVRRTRQRLASILLKHGVDLPTGIRLCQRSLIADLALGVDTGPDLPV